MILTFFANRKKLSNLQKFNRLGYLSTHVEDRFSNFDETYSAHLLLLQNSLFFDLELLYILELPHNYTYNMYKIGNLSTYFLLFYTIHEISFYYRLHPALQNLISQEFQLLCKRLIHHSVCQLRSSKIHTEDKLHPQIILEGQKSKVLWIQLQQWTVNMLLGNLDILKNLCPSFPC